MGDIGKDAGNNLANKPGEKTKTRNLAKLTMPDGQELELPVLTDASGGRFLDIRKLHPRCEAIFTLLALSSGE